MQTTRAAVLYQTGNSAPYAESRPLVIEELTLSDPGPGEVLVEIAGAGLCHSDLSVIDGNRPRVMPMVLGHEASGIVREVGPGVSELAPGDHVIFAFVPACRHCVPCATGRAALCENGARSNVAGTLLGGARRFHGQAGELNHHLGVSAFSQFTVAAQESLVKIDPALPLTVAALFGCAVMTGVGAAINTAKVVPGSSVVVFGCGGVGISVIQGARVCGAAEIIAVDLVDDKLETAKKFGATHAVKPDDLAALSAELTGGAGFDYAFEAIGSPVTMRAAYDAIRRGGMAVIVGVGRAEQTFELSAFEMFYSEKTLVGSYYGSTDVRSDFARIIRLWRAGKLDLEAMVTRTIALEDINEALGAMERGEVVRQVITL